MTTVRAALVLAGLGMLGYGGWLLAAVVTASGPQVLVWFASAALVQDLVLLPVLGVAVLLVRRFAPRRLHGPISVVAVLVGIVVLLAIPLRWV